MDRVESYGLRGLKSAAAPKVSRCGPVVSDSFDRPAPGISLRRRRVGGEYRRSSALAEIEARVRGCEIAGPAEWVATDALCEELLQVYRDSGENLCATDRQTVERLAAIAHKFGLSRQGTVLRRPMTGAFRVGPRQRGPKRAAPVGTPLEYRSC